MQFNLRMTPVPIMLSSALVETKTHIDDNQTVSPDPTLRFDMDGPMTNLT
jgi:hypothetical protein